MGDSGSQVLGFVLAALGARVELDDRRRRRWRRCCCRCSCSRSRSSTRRSSPCARSLERRPVTQGGKDHTSHRLVYYGLSEQQAVGAAGADRGALGATALAYNVLDNARVTAIGVLVSFVVLVQFASFLTDLERADAPRRAGPAAVTAARVRSNPRRLVEVLVDFVLICASFLAAYLLVVDGERHRASSARVFLATLPLLLGVRYVAFVLFGIYRRVWRFATARDLLAIAAASRCLALVALASSARRRRSRLPARVFVVDALLCTALVAASRLALRWRLPRVAPPAGRPRSACSIVGAGRSRTRARARARARRRTARRRASSTTTRASGGGGSSASRCSASWTRPRRCIALARPDEVLVTIPDVAAGRG